MTADFHYLQDDYTTVDAVFITKICLDKLSKWGDELRPNHTYADDFYQDNKDSAYCQYTFKADTSLGLKVNDLAVVHVKSGFGVVQIVAVHRTPQLDPNAHFDYKWVVDKISLNGFLARLQEEKTLKDKLAQLAYFEKANTLKQKLQAMDKAQNDNNDQTQN